jgi:hypothetical protein
MKPLTHFKSALPLRRPHAPQVPISASFWGAHASRVLFAASRRKATPVTRRICACLSSPSRYLVNHARRSD